MLIFLLEREILSVAVPRISQDRRKWWFLSGIAQRKWLLRTLLVTFCCYEYGANASEAVQKIAIDQKDYDKCSSGVLLAIVCWIAAIYQSITVKNGWLLELTRTPPA